MDIHKPRPWHGLREFLKEYVIIVVGVLTALGAEQGVEWLHWRYQVQEAEAAMQAEVREDLVFAYERAVTQPCLAARINAIVGQLREEGPTWRGMTEPLAHSSTLPVVYPRVGRPWYSDAWENAKMSGALAHMGRERFARYGEIYSLVGHVHQRQDEEVPLEAGLAPLAFDTRLDAHDRTGLISRMGELDRLNGQVSGGSGSLFRLAEKQGIRLRQDEADAAMARLQEFGACLRRPSVPLG